ncbi:MAG TPA: TRAP transporter TatT component family protein [Blastocatellia bacterium]|nr:TRAP transporter TatT component family protein [Blastocatellia bacterium]
MGLRVQFIADQRFQILASTVDPDAIDASDELYRNRTGPESGRKVLVKLGEVQNGGSSYDVQWRLSRGCFLAGQDQPSLFDQGWRHGMAAVRLEPERVEGNFWAGVNLALSAEQIGGPKGALLVLRARTRLRRAVSINESYHGAGPLRVLARLYHKAPWILGGSRGRSRRSFDRALEIEPNNSVTLIYAAELAIDSGERSRAIDLLQRIMAKDLDLEWAFELERDKALAYRLLEKLNGNPVTG